MRQCRYVRWIGAGALACWLHVMAAVAQAPPIADALASLRAVQRFDEVSLSPDGRSAVYGNVISGKRGGAEVDVSALWLVEARAGSAPVRLTACPGQVCDEHGASWSPDGKHVAFVTTDTSEQTQVAIASADGSGVRVLTAAHGPVDTPRWSPDGRHIAFLYSEGAPRTPGPLHPLARAAGVLGATVYEQRLATIPAQGGAISVLGPADLNIYEYDWSPDSGRFAVTAAHGSGDDNWWIAELDLLDANSGAVTTLLKPPLQMASPRWSGDGRRIAYIGGIMSDQGSTGGDVYLVPAAGGGAVNVTAGLAASVQTITWNGSARHIIATEFAAGESVLADIDADAKSQRQLWRAAEMIWANSLLGRGPGDAGISLSRNGAVSAVIRQSYTTPPEVQVGPPGRWQAITAANVAVRSITGKATNITWKSDGFDVQGMLIEPPTVVAGRRYPLVVLVHGGPASAHLPIFPASARSFDAVLASQGYFVCKPNPRGSYGQGEAFTRANVRDFGYGDLRDILSGLDAVLQTAPVDAARVGITGWSYGGFMTMWALTQTERFKAAVAGAGLSDWLSYYGTNDIDTWMLPYFGASVYDDPQVYARSSPIAFIRNVHTPTLIVGGDRDAEVPITQSYEYWNALRRLGVKTEFVVYPDEGHAFFKHADQVDLMTRLVGWFNTYLRPGTQQ
ncbi:MAG TPA: S9 family peptidase [Steroidobacteraceae bacterium]|nr:S9 family peptidase [Steroidobacteraceae bacterium]